MYICQVLVDIKARQLDRKFTYLSNKIIPMHSRVRIKFSNRVILGIVLNCELTNFTKSELDDYYGFKLGWIVEIIDNYSVISETQIKIIDYIKMHSFAPLISCYSAVLPATKKLSSSVLSHKSKLEKYYIVNEFVNLTPKQQECFNYVENSIEITRKELLTVFSNSVIKGCVEKRALLEKERTAVQSIDYCKARQSKSFNLNNHQQKIYDQVISTSKKQFLLHGVTGSGKTEVYIKLSEYYLKEKKQILILIPEIVLSLQLYSRFKEYFSDQVALLHSKLSKSEKAQELARIESCQANIIIGTRSAIFTELSQLSLIIVDECHDDSFQQTTTPRYRIYDIANIICTHKNAKLLLASATPDLYSYALSKRSILKKLELSEKFFSGPKTQTNIIDMKEAFKVNQMSILSNELYDAMKEDFKNGHQVILLVNRRGYAPTVVCQSCSTVKKCKDCDLSLVYHNDSKLFCCHYCGYQESSHAPCIKCQHEQFSYIGVGIQKVEQLCEQLFKDINIERMDADTTRLKGSVVKILDNFKQQKAQLLIGTQMIAKGLDFDNVSTVGIINIDSTLMLPHFSACEKAFQLLVQVMGRTGRRNQESRLFVQTMYPDHYAIKMAVNNDYEAFYQQEMNFRRAMKYPPYFNLCRVKIGAKDLTNAQIQAQSIFVYLNEKLPAQCIVSKPMKSFVNTNKEYEIFEIIIKYKVFEQINLTLIELMSMVNQNFLLQIDNNYNEL